MQFIMKKFIFVCLAACLGFVGCEKDEGKTMLPQYYGYSTFYFMVCDADGNNVFAWENLNMEELTLEYKGQIFTPIPLDNQQRPVKQHIEADNQWIVFQPDYIINNDDPVLWRIWGNIMYGESARYILRYKDNEWVCDYSSEEIRFDGSVPDDELYVNGEKVEKIYAYTLPDHPDWERSEEERMVWVYPLYVK